MKKSRKLLFGKTLFIAFACTIGLTVLLVYLTGLSTHRSMVDNSLISVSLLAAFLFLFLTFGLFNGLDVLDNYEHKLKLVWKKAKKRVPENYLDIGDTDISLDGGDGIAGIILAIIVWVFVSIILVFLLVFMQAIAWMSIVLLVLAFYWIMIRALKLIFSKSEECEDDLSKSMIYAMGYTVLYTGWIYGIILISTMF